MSVNVDEPVKKPVEEIIQENTFNVNIIEQSDSMIRYKLDATTEKDTVLHITVREGKDYHITGRYKDKPLNTTSTSMIITKILRNNS